ncbi:hypothetical protein BGW36DRAFT_21546 [Talaromyces proteolyticus]|uniref:Carrier domain-containing protein n=1 Tax=Talaromyces proteolyticus TaxID=1131652 RepID=A0AAD4Q4C9_9EURO|nr:uncharacterized protein BGW36DRAFT_21546 [Talaromyces proteolyticus]KAH8706029.1 hypothetical protein BGW36DRAFT_21546 [Talaromyces proteolyticus]
MHLNSEEFNPRVQLIPHTFDHYARVKPDAIYAEYTVSPISYEHGYRPITFRDFANAVNGLAWWLTETFGPGNGEILPYIGLNDVRYPALIIAAVKAGYSIFVTSPRNSVAAQDHLFKQLNCTKLLTPAPRPPPVVALAEILKTDVFEIPSVADLVNKKYPDFEYTRTYPDHVLDKVVVIHTSGSTGMPKPLFYTHDSFHKTLEMGNLSAPEGYESQNEYMHGKRMFLTLPAFHAAGVAFMISISLAMEITLIIPITGGLPTAAALAQATKLTRIDSAFVVPSIVQELAQDSELLAYCSEHLDLLAYCGGDLPQSIGDTVASKIRLVNQYGATEVGLLHSIHSKTNRDPRKDWRYVHFHPQIGTEFFPVTDSESELVVVRSPEDQKYQVPFTMYPDRQEYHTNDLWVRHPDPNKRDLWRWSSRMDDIIVLLNGEKTNPISMEQHIVASNAEISGALVAGAQRFQACLIIELSADYLKSLGTSYQGSPGERMAMIEKFWPSIAEANASAPAHARIAKTHILFTSPDRPMLRAGKGTVQRAGTLKLYAQELDELYDLAEKLDSTEDSETSGPGSTDDIQKLSQYIVQTLSNITKWGPDKINDTDNFFSLGLDSLQAITAARRFRYGLDFPRFTPNLIYLNPSVEKLAQAIIQSRNDIKTSKKLQVETQLKERNDILLEYAEKINTVEKHTVILTGSTGNLGTYILNVLLNHPSVAHIHCLNRRVPTTDGASNGNHFDPQRVSFWKTDLSRPDLGLQPEALEKLKAETTLIIHNAWTVNFNLYLPSFKPHLSGVVNLINFCSSAAKSPHLFFLSSVSSVLGHQIDSYRIPEAVIETKSPAPNGYGSSKYVAEQLLLHAARNGSSTGMSLARVGQVAGAVQSPGLWNKNEWLPSLILSSLHVGAIPDNIGTTLGHIDWMPVDSLAEVLVELALRNDSATSDRPVNVFHPMNQHPLTWGDIRDIFSEALSQRSSKKIKTIPLADWIQLVRSDIESASKDVDLQALLAVNPAAKLLDFFDDALNSQSAGYSLEAAITAERSEKLRNVSAIKPEWIEKWVAEWLQ